MSDRARLGPIGRRLLGALLFVSMTGIGVHVVGTVVPHLVAREGHGEAVSVGWLLAATGIALVVAALVSVVVARRLIAPLRELVDAARAFSVGDHSVRLPDLARPELAELADALNAAASEVERSERTRRQLSADIAHELRTPLTALQAGLEELRDGLVTPDPSTLASLHDQATRLGRLVEDLGELAAAESAGLQLSLERADLARVATLAVTAWEGALAAAGLLVRQELTPGVVVLGDVDRLHQVAGNLVANAGLYCRPGDEVAIRVRSEGAQGILEVADTGPGFTTEELRLAFDRSWRGTSAAGTQGSGLGLAIVRALVLAQGGTVDITSTVGGGATIRVRLPLATAGADTGPPLDVGSSRG
jgi:two-component system sensor histidine kinase BaeS